MNTKKLLTIALLSATATTAFSASQPKGSGLFSGVFDRFKTAAPATPASEQPKSAATEKPTPTSPSEQPKTATASEQPAPTPAPQLVHAKRAETTSTQTEPIEPTVFVEEKVIVREIVIERPQTLDQAKARVCRERTQQVEYLTHKFVDDYLTKFTELRDNERLVEKLQKQLSHNNPTQQTSLSAAALAAMSPRSRLWAIPQAIGAGVCFKKAHEAFEAAAELPARAKSNGTVRDFVTKFSENICDKLGHIFSTNPLGYGALAAAGAYLAWRSGDNLLDWYEDSAAFKAHNELHAQSKKAIETLTATETAAELKKDHLPQVKELLNKVQSAKQYLGHVSKAEQEAFKVKEDELLKTLKEAGYAPEFVKA